MLCLVDCYAYGTKQGQDLDTGRLSPLIDSVAFQLGLGSSRIVIQLLISPQRS